MEARCHLEERLPPWPSWTYCTDQRKRLAQNSPPEALHSSRWLAEAASRHNELTDAGFHRRAPRMNNQHCWRGSRLGAEDPSRICAASYFSSGAAYGSSNLLLSPVRMLTKIAPVGGVAVRVHEKTVSVALPIKVCVAKSILARGLALASTMAPQALLALSSCPSGGWLIVSLPARLADLGSFPTNYVSSTAKPGRAKSDLRIVQRLREGFLKLP